MKDKLAKILTPEQLAEVEKALGGTLDYVPRTRLNEVITERDSARHDLDEFKAKSSKYDEAAAKVTELTTKLTEAEEAHKKELGEVRRSSSIETALIQAGAKNIKTVLPLLDSAKIGEDLKGLDEEIKRVKTSDGYLFGASAAPGGTGKQGGDPPPAKSEELKTQLAEAQKTGRTADVIRITRQIYELEKSGT